MKNEQLIDDILNKYTDNGRIIFSEIGEHKSFKNRYKWYKDFIKQELPDFTEEDIIKFYKNYHKFKDTIYAFNGFDFALNILEKEIEHENIKNK